MKFRLRPAGPDDEEFLYRAYAGTRDEELAFLNWDAAQQEIFLRMQFKAQRQSYRALYPAAAHSIILCAEQPAGRMMVNDAATEITLVDITLLPEYRGQGIGTALIRELIDTAAQFTKVIRLHVAKANTKAERLYERLGFSQCGDDGMYLEMKYVPGKQSGPATAAK